MTFFCECFFAKYASRGIGYQCATVIGEVVTGRMSNQAGNQARIVVRLGKVSGFFGEVADHDAYPKAR